MELTRRDFLALAASAAPLAAVGTGVLWPGALLAGPERSERAEAPPPSSAPDPYAWDELPLRGLAGACSGASR